MKPSRDRSPTEEQINAWLRYRYPDSPGLRVMMPMFSERPAICNPDHGWSVNMTDAELRAAKIWGIDPRGSLIPSPLQRP